MTRLPKTHTARTSPDLKVLLEEYKINRASMERSLANIIQIVGYTTGATAIIGAYLMNGPQLSPYVAWLLPSAILVIYALVIFNSASFISYLWSTRVAAERINFLAKSTPLTRYVPEYPSSSYFSFTRGSLPFQSIILLFFIAATFFFAYALIMAFSIVYPHNHFAGISLLVVYLSIAAIELNAQLNVLRELPRRYRILYNELRTQRSLPSPQEFKSLVGVDSPTDQRRLLALILPRHHDLLIKGIYFLYGYVAALLLIGQTPLHLPTLNLLFGGSVPWPSIGDVPLHIKYAFGIILFVVAEVLLQQGKILWNDIRDFHRDQDIPLNSRRALASKIITVREAKTNLLLRIALALALGYVLGGLPLVGVFCLILAHQALYELWAKPRTKDGNRGTALWALTILSFNISLRYMAGAVAAVGAVWTSWPLLLLFVVFWFLSFGGMAFQWRLEMEDILTHGNGKPFRGQSIYFLNNGMRWQNRGDLPPVGASCLAN